MIKSVVAIASGAVLGALLRWSFAAQLNRLFPAIPPGTVVANWLGAYLVGLIAGLFVANPHWLPEWRLFIFTGFLGALTTFSTFSLEVVSLLQLQRYGAALLAVSLHLFGSLLLTIAGFTTARWLG
ncbi:fluoride efflux transporter CrcB [Vogesella indigofera]|uniref:fluoride efflux transporter CrcB n=1 Tax=Vogesella indigofera TaxID=45465 RepID=UPI00234F1F2F|nr:fluoride efflux transporter CrcB [Vogesella indigofera]MDC7707851.1 fluoride efflux transporter CrcB [Vogesella indigofera]